MLQACPSSEQSDSGKPRLTLALTDLILHVAFVRPQFWQIPYRKHGDLQVCDLFELLFIMEQESSLFFQTLTLIGNDKTYTMTSKQELYLRKSKVVHFRLPMVVCLLLRVRGTTHF